MAIIDSWQMRYSRAGISSIPIRAHAKTPYSDAWQARAPADQWREAGANFRGNIGLLAGRGVAFVDCDDQRAADHVSAWAAGLGLADAPRVRTPHGGQHLYLRVASDIPPAFNWARLSAHIGAGELRARNAYVLAPCSELADGRYKFASGTLEAWTARPVSWRDLRALIGTATARQTTTGTAAALESLPVRLLWRPLSPSDMRLFGLLRTTPKGAPIGDYRTRSEAEAALVAIMILRGWDFDAILEEFEKRQASHFAEHRAGAHYLAHVYHSAVSAIAGTPERMQLAELYAAAEREAWPGRTGGTDHAVTLAMLGKLYAFSAFEFGASVREIAEHAAMTVKTAHKSTHRLTRAGRFEPRGRPAADRGTIWHLGPMYHRYHSSKIFARAPQNPHFPPVSDRLPPGSTTVTTVVTMIHSGAAELFAQSALGKSAGLILAHLTATPARVCELARLSGKSRITVHRVLSMLARYGVAERVGRGQWRRGSGDLNKLADTFQVAERARRRRATHALERERFDAARVRAGQLKAAQR